MLLAALFSGIFVLQTKRGAVIRVRHAKQTPFIHNDGALGVGIDFSLGAGSQLGQPVLHQWRIRQSGTDLRSASTAGRPE